MKSRIDFVSNSSSSSFICYAKEDVFFKGNFATITYNQMMDQIRYDLICEFDDYRYERHWNKDPRTLKERWKFIPDQKYIEDFGCNHEIWTAPESLKDMVLYVCDTFNEYLEFFDSKKDNMTDDEKVTHRKMCDTLYQTFTDEEGQLFKKIKVLLEPTYGGELYHRNSYSDHEPGWYPENKDGFSDSAEDCMKMDFAKAKISFKKIISEH